MLYRNPLRCFRKAFSVFLVFICAVDLFIGIVVCSGETLTRFLCAFGDQRIPQGGDILRILGYIGVWHFSRCLPFNRPTFTGDVSSFHNFFGLSGNILLFKEAIASFSSESTNLVQQHSASQQATRSNGHKGKKVGCNFLFHFTVSCYFSGPILCGYHN